MQYHLYPPLYTTSQYPYVSLLYFTSTITPMMHLIRNQYLTLRHNTLTLLYLTVPIPLHKNDTLPLRYSTSRYLHKTKPYDTFTILNKTLPLQYCTKPILAHPITIPYNTDTLRCLTIPSLCQTSLYRCLSSLRITHTLLYNTYMLLIVTLPRPDITSWYITKTSHYRTAPIPDVTLPLQHNS